MQYPEIHIWDFPPTKTHIRLKDGYREKLIQEFVSCFRTNKDAVKFLNEKSLAYGEQRKYGFGQTSTWKKGFLETENQKNRIPLWALLEISKVISKNENRENSVCLEIESNIEFYCGRSNSTPVYGKFPLRLTPELVSIIFHLCGDGFFADEKGKSSSYRQVNQQGLDNFGQKLKNSFGNFEINKTQIKDYKVPIPRVITDFYIHYFGLGDLRWNVARIPEKIKQMDKEYLVAGLTAFVVDEGHIGDNIEIYSGNLKLLGDIRNIATQCGYLCNGPRPKSRMNTKDFRLYISLKSVMPFANDIRDIATDFPTCDLSHKQGLFDLIVKRHNPTLKREKNGVTKMKILTTLSDNQMNTLELCFQIPIAPSSLKEHLTDLEKKGKITRVITDKLSRPYWKKSVILR